MEFVIKDLKDEVTGDNKSKDRAEQELVKLRADIGSKEKELQKIKPKYEEMKKKEDECTRELALKVINHSPNFRQLSQSFLLSN